MTFHYLVEGTVQGVAFRYHTKMAASKLGISGTVKNLNDGSVEIYAGSTPEAIVKFESFLKNSPGHSEVKKITKKEVDHEFDGHGFSIIC